MSLLIPPGFGLAAWTWTGPAGTSPYVTTLGVDLSGLDDDYVAAANFLMICMGVEVGPLINSRLTLDKCTLSVGQDGPGGSVDSNEPAIEMDNGGAVGPTSMSVIFRKSTNNLGRAGRGRMFIPGSATESGVNDDGSLTAGFRNDAQVCATNLYESIEGGETVTGTPVTGPAMSTVLLHSEGVGAPAPTAIVGLNVASKVGWIRGRIR